MKKTFCNKYVQRSILFIILLFSIIVINAKGRYLAKYNTTITENINGHMHSDSCNYSSDFSVDLLQGKLRVTIYHERITPDLEKAFKSLKTTANLHVMSSVVSGVSGLYDAIKGETIKSEIKTTEAQMSANNATLAAKKLEELANLKVELVLENNSDEELLINDVWRGLTWFIQPHTDVTMVMPERKMKLRASTVQISQQPISLIDITALSEVRYYDALCEDDFSIYCSPPKSGEMEEMYLRPKNPKYYRINKNTLEETEITENEYKTIKKMVKESRSHEPMTIIVEYE